MNLDKISQKLAEFNKTDSPSKEKVDYEKIFWKPAMGDSTIRIVPSAFDKDYPFKELKFHYIIGKYPMLALSNFGKQDPVEAYIKDLKAEYSKENWSLAGKLTPKVRIFAPVIVRGEESKGVRLWSFGIKVYKSLLAYANDPDYGDFSDQVTGRDIVVEVVAGNPYPTTNIRIKPKESPLSAKDSQLEDWLTNQPNPLEVYNEPDYDFVKTKLTEFVEAYVKGESPVQGKDTEGSEEPVKKEPVKLGTMSTPKEQIEEVVVNKKPSIASQFDDLFPEDDDDN